MGQVATNEFKAGMKIEVDGQPYTIVTVDQVKPGKGQAFCRVRIKHLLSGRTIEKTWKSGDKVDEADVNEAKVRMLYKDDQAVVFMDDNTFEQVTIPVDVLGDTTKWLKEDLIYEVIFYKGNPVNIEPPTFMELKIVRSDPAVRGDTSGRVMKPAVLETGAEVQIPLFIDEGEVVRFDTRTGDYVSRVKE